MQIDATLKKDGILPSSPDGDQKVATARRTIAGALYLLLIAAAAIMRIVNLAGIPLSPTEAAEALAAWQILQPGSMQLVAGSPAYFTITSLLFPVIGDSDAVTRLVPALFGIALIAIPWFSRRHLGMVGALVAAAFFAASPLNSTIARTAGGDAIAIFAVLLAATALINSRDAEREHWAYALAVAVGLGLASSPLFYGGLLTLCLAWLFTAFVGAESWRSLVPHAQSAPKAIIVGLLVFIAMSTRFLTYPAGLGAAAGLLGNWLSQFGFAGGFQSLLAPFLVLARYEVALLIAGLAAVVWAIWKIAPFRLLLAVWLASILILMILQGGIIANALLATLPGYLLIGLFTANLLARTPDHWTWALVASLLLVAAILLVNLTRYLRVSQYEQDLSNIWLGILALAAAALIIYYFWGMTDAMIGVAIWLAVLVMLFTFEWGTAWRLAQNGANDPRESWVAQGTDDDLPLLISTLGDISRQVTNSDADLQILSAVDTPVVRWYLRNFHQAIIGQTVPPGARHETILSLDGGEEPRLGADYVGSDFGLLRKGSVPPIPSDTPLADVLRWWLFQETSAGIYEDRLILWVRSDLVLPQR